MQISINECTVYFHLKTVRPEEIPVSTISDVECGLLYNANEDLVGIKLYRKEFESECRIELPKLGEQEVIVPKLDFYEDEQSITISFDSSLQVEDEVVHDCIIDYCERGIVGIELLPYASVGGTKVIKQFLL